MTEKSLNNSDESASENCEAEKSSSAEGCSGKGGSGNSEAENELSAYRRRRCLEIEDNLKEIREKIERAALSAGRSSSDIRLMAVTKTVEPFFISHALSCGISLIGENRVQELLEKKPKLCLDDVQLHLIGHLQTNKVKQVLGEVSMIQSVDSLKLAREIGRQSERRGVVSEVLLEVNIGGEESKYGFRPEELDERVCEAAEIAGLHINGLMCVPPLCEDTAKLRGYFEAMRKLLVDTESKKIDNVCMNILSMGMSSDYEDAVLCGSNLLRIGSAVFGARIY